MTGPVAAQELFEDAPCGLVSARPDGTIARVNRTFEEWTGLRREELIGRRRFQDLLSPGGRIYHETHYAPLLRMQGRVRAIAVEIVRADGTRLPALVNSVLRDDRIDTAIFDATDRRRYEEELLHAGRREADVALELQRSLLAGALPEAEGLETGVAYRPAEQGREAGGDWYDVFWLDEPRTAAVVVGDVVGRGLRAAATMGQLRSAVRALASTGLGPADVLAALDAFSDRHGVGQMATVAYARLDLPSRRLRYACAGHPPQVLVEDGAAARYLWDGRSAPLAAYTRPTARLEGEASLAAGATLALYTDGLIERHDRAMDSSLDALLQGVEEVRAHAPAALASALVQRLAALGDSAPDDVCVLALRLA